jgi:hypothetical protein
VTGSPTRPDFSGLWEINLEKSVLRGRPARRVLVKIEHDEPRLVQTIIMWYGDGAEERLRFSYTTDGKTSLNAIRGIVCETQAHWEGEELVLESSMKTPDRELHFRDHWSLSDRGRTLTMAHPDDDVAGRISVLEQAPPGAAESFSEPR